MDNTFTNFQNAVYFAIEERHLEDECDIIEMQEIVETHEPVDNFRPVDEMSGKKAGREYNTPYGVVVIRSNMRRFAGDSRHDMYIFADADSGITFIGHGH